LVSIRTVWLAKASWCAGDEDEDDWRDTGKVDGFVAITSSEAPH
jgi:hypothetical protein